MSLYRTGFFIRRFILMFFIFIGVLVSFGIIGTITAKLSSQSTNKIDETSSLGFGTINPVKIKANSQADVFKPLNFDIDTLTGTLPDLKSVFNVSNISSALVNVYQIDIPAIQADSRQKGLDLAESLKFTAQPKITDKDLKYEWSDGKRNLVYNVDTKTFEMYTSNIASINTAPETFGTLDGGQNFFKDFLKNIKINTEDPQSYFKNDYVKYNFTKATWDIVPESEKATANFVRVSYMRSSRTRGSDPLPAVLDISSPDATIVKEYYPAFDYSPMYAIIKNTAAATVNDIVEMNFYKYDYSISRPQTYKAKSVEKAYEELKNKQATLVKVTTSNNQPIDSDKLALLQPTVKVKQVDVGYYLSSARTGYALPIYVFQCDFVISTEGVNQTKGTAVYYTYAFTN